MRYHIHDQLDLLQKSQSILGKICEEGYLSSMINPKVENEYLYNQCDLLNKLLKSSLKYIKKIEADAIDSSITIQYTLPIFVDGIRRTYQLRPDRISEYYCHNGKIIFFTKNEIVYFTTPVIRYLKPGTSYDIQIESLHTGNDVFFWIIETDVNQQIIKQNFKLENTITDISFKTTPQMQKVVFALRVAGNGVARVKSVNVSQSKSKVFMEALKLPQEARATSDMRFAYILDEFTETSIKYECGGGRLEKSNPEQLLADFKPEFVLVESCWQGNGKTWGALNEKNFGQRKLAPILEACAKAGIPTIFWNKEDPFHYDGFKNIANMFDYIFTTDANMIPRYKKDLGRRVFCLPFAAQPRLHHPRGWETGRDRAFFAGSWYSEKAERCKEFMDLARNLDEAGIEYDIYDRCQSLGMERYAWPDQFQGRILGQLTPEEVYRLTPDYRFQINVNTVKDSSTMFARRVFESLACGTPVITNHSSGIKRMFPNLTVMLENGLLDKALLNDLRHDDEFYRAVQEAGVFAVMREHTWAHRLARIGATLGINVKASKPDIAMIFYARSRDEAMAAEAAFGRQTWENKKLFISLEPFDKYYEFLNKNTREKIYILKKESPLQVSDYISADFLIECDPDYKYPDTFLEKYIYANYDKICVPGLQ